MMTVQKKIWTNKVVELLKGVVEKVVQDEQFTGIPSNYLASAC